MSNVFTAMLEAAVNHARHLERQYADYRDSKQREVADLCCQIDDQEQVITGLRQRLVTIELAVAGTAPGVSLPCTSEQPRTGYAPYYQQGQAVAGRFDPAAPSPGGGS